MSGHNFKALSCTPTYLNAPISNISAYKLLRNLLLLDSNLLIINANICAKEIHMLRSRNWGLKYVDVQDRALKLCPVPSTCEVSREHL